jgi:CubicO group peptidase (beta-lactamase class C family)
MPPLEQIAPRGTALVVGTAEGVWSRGVPGDAVFEIGSISKTFTATLLASLVADGVVAYDEPVARHLPVKPPVKGRQITFEDLATHHSGLPRLPGGMLASAFTRERHDPYASFDDARLQRAIAETAPKRAPGEKFTYSNYGYGLLGCALARAARTS